MKSLSCQWLLLSSLSEIDVGSRRRFLPSDSLEKFRQAMTAGEHQLSSSSPSFYSSHSFTLLPKVGPMSSRRESAMLMPGADASHVQHRARRHSYLHPQESPRRHRHKVCTSCEILARRQIFEAQSHAKEEIRPAPDAAE